MIKQTSLHTIKGVLPLLFLIFFASCKKDASNIGLGLVDDNLAGANTLSFSDIRARTVPSDSLRTDSLRANILGVIQDPIFGLSKSSLVIQPRYTQASTAITGATIDSAFVILDFRKDQLVGSIVYDLDYGDLDSELEIKVYKLANMDSLTSNRAYYHTFSPGLGDEVGSYRGRFQAKNSDSVTIISAAGETIRVGPRLSIPITTAFATEVLANPDFFSRTNGLVVAPSSSIISGIGAMVGIETASAASGVVVHYTLDGESTTFVVPLGLESERINFYETVPSSPIEQQFATPGEYPEVYAMPLGGTKVKVDIDGLEEIIEMEGDFVINEAVITFTLDEMTLTDDLNAPVRMFLQVPQINADGSVSDRSVPFIDLIDDLLPPNRDWLGFTTYGGDLIENSYTFRFTRYMQQLVDEYKETEKNNFNGFYLSIPSQFPNKPSRVVINSDRTQGDIQLSVTYTKLN